MFKNPSDKKFGTIQGVLIPNILQMIGAILFFRLGYVLGHCGIYEMAIIITLSALLLFITALSLGSIVSNMKMSGGGAYFLISRSLGIEFGSAIGILSLISQLCSITLCVTAFSLSLYEFFPSLPLPAIKAGTLAILILISYFSTNLALKTQILIFVSLAVSIGAIFLGSGAPLDSLSVSQEASAITFWGCFALFFPAMTGIEAGMSMSGDLRNPSRSLPIGTFGAIAIVYAVYLGIAYFLSYTVPAELLKSHTFILYYMSKVGYLIILGIWAATLSSALGAILGAPRVMQAVAKDGILPSFLSKGSGETNQPRMATLSVFLLALILTLGTDIDQIIPMLTMSCLLSYGLINFIAFFESFMQNPSYRPALKTHWTISLAGATCCFIAMFMINPGAAFIVIALVFIFCIWTAKRKIKGNWDDLKHSLISFIVHKATIKLSNIEVSAKSWRPYILTVFGQPLVQKNLAYFSYALNQGKGFLTFGANVPSTDQFEGSYQNLKEDLKGFKISSHLHLNVCPDHDLGIDQIVRNYGFGLLKPNTVILALPKEGNSESMIRLLLDAHFQHKNVVILKEDSSKDYLYMDPTRKGKQINLWWRGKYPGNFELCLAFAYLLQQSKLWPRSKICVKMIAKDPAAQSELLKQFDQYRAELRIKNLQFTPIIDQEEKFFSNFEAHSKDGDLSFLGLRQPTPGTTVEEYTSYLQNLLENTKRVSNVAFVLCGEKVEFRNIFTD